MFNGDWNLLDIVKVILDISIVWYVLYKLLMLIRGTKAIQLLKGIFVVIGLYLASVLLDLTTVRIIIWQVIMWGPLGIIILFQPELRRALEQLGRGSFFSRNTTSEEEELNHSIEAIVESCKYMGKRRIGALITIERETAMGDYVSTGIPINGHLTNQMLTNIFIPNTPLHDGAVIINRDRIVAAACYLPLSESPFISKELGTRHRAALGISEVTDAVTIIVSEETGSISCTKNGELHRNITAEKLSELLENELVTKFKTSTTKAWNWRGKKNE
ncbi:diadenylate cyclase CdaA [Gracilibacillus caseinilyticus]|uniref:Diadenylate cyclase n=1 Tax=Gracilibacillus caseinilyticus TaxID=2932256 RepID=A0ABY4F0D0_9BACI|nr:diadenylate cyclase CdaA [Gracilibacillus caseinilyticus]UOQ49364.1 diadenylate cyclase CdaA [Gracilibacillus caseinilyticus]